MAPSVVEKANPVETVKSLSKEEFQEQVQDWMCAQQQKLQSKLRAELIENFNKTSLGRDLAAQMRTKQGIVLSPLLLVLNTVVSEFLYSEDYHFSLSVFTSEVVFPHTLPDFNGNEAFRFTQEQLREIFGALGVTEEAHEDIVGEYEASRKSLLYAIIKTLLEKRPKMHETFVLEESEAPLKAPKTTPDGLRQAVDPRNVAALNKTVEKLSKSIKNLAEHYMNLENSRVSSKTGSKKGEKTEDRHYSNLLRHIEAISNKLDRCCVGLSRVEAMFPPSEAPFDSYKSWLRVMRESENGQKYMAKFQRALQRMWEDKKREMKAYYRAKYDAEARIFDERKKATEVNREAIKEVLEHKMASLESKESNISAKIEKIHEAVHQVRDDERSKKAQFEQISRSIGEALRAVQTNVLRTSLAPSTRSAEDVDQIIKGAKSRIRQLEAEGEKLEKTFAKYMERQMSSKQAMEVDRLKIWQDYQSNRRALQTLPLNVPVNVVPKEAPKNPAPKKHKSESESLVSSEKVANVVQKSSSSFSNPFRAFDTVEYLQKAHERHILEGPKLDRLEAYRRLDRDVESFKARYGFSASRSIFAQGSVKSLPTPPKGILKEAQVTFETPQKTLERPQKTLERPQDTFERPSDTFETPQELKISERATNTSPSDNLDFRDVSLDIDLSRTKSSGSSKSPKIDAIQEVSRIDEQIEALEMAEQVERSLQEAHRVNEATRSPVPEQLPKIVVTASDGHQRDQPRTSSGSVMSLSPDMAEEVLRPAREFLERSSSEAEKREPMRDFGFGSTSSDSDKIVISTGKRMSSEEGSEAFWD